jgi:hypothetical protein
MLGCFTSLLVESKKRVMAYSLQSPLAARSFYHEAAVLSYCTVEYPHRSLSLSLARSSETNSGIVRSYNLTAAMIQHRRML